MISSRLKLSLFVFVLSFLFQTTTSAQELNVLDITQRHLEENLTQLDLTTNDIQHFRVDAQRTSKQNQATYLYLVQTHNGVDIHNAIMTVGILPNGKVFHVANRFVKDAAQKINATTANLTPVQAVQAAAQNLRLEAEGSFTIKETRENVYYISPLNVAREPIKARLKYQLMEEGDVRLAWDLEINETRSSDWWTMRVDAISGTVLDIGNYTVYCKFDHTHSNGRCNHRLNQEKEKLQIPFVKSAAKTLNPDSYNVFQVPLESPAHGDRSIAINPADSTASPYGWHDVDGMPGAEYTITRGNNVHAFLDLGDIDISSGDEPDGGAGLDFDFPLDQSQEPDQYREAAVVNLFYMNNMIHDVLFHYGFDEDGGNFQETHYGSGVVAGAGDYVIAQAQDGGGINNANFGTPSDGGSGRMQMYLWDRSSQPSNFLTVDAPNVIAGGFESTQAGFGGQLDGTPLTGELVIVDDGSNSPTLACDPIQNGNEIDGKIALIDRGTCQFGEKILNAENNGAIAVVICNYEEDLVSMAAGNVGDQVTIPSVFLRYGDCQLIRGYIDNPGVTLTLMAPPATGPEFLDGDFDNGIIAHEYGHGVSNRLTGGRFNSGCLGNAEQQGEGWSDFMSLILGTFPGDQGSDRRGIGTFVTREDNDGQGIRRYPYTTDMTINPHTYDDIITINLPHGLGSVWCAMIWDLYWAMTDLHGYDDDLHSGTGGNNMAIQLVMDGMALQPCSPGFTDSRDAILAADVANYNGAHQCLIWEVFARRGLGYSATQGSTSSVTDGVQAFDVAPTCIPELKVSITADEVIEEGGEINYEVNAVNHTGTTQTNVQVSVELPPNTTFISATSGGTVSGNTLTFNMGTMNDGDEADATFKLASDMGFASTLDYEDDFEDDYNDWAFSIISGNSALWDLADFKGYDSNQSIWILGNVDVNDIGIHTRVDIVPTGSNPGLRFYQDYDLEAARDGGIVEVTTDDPDDPNAVWEDQIDNIFKFPYRGKLQGPSVLGPNRPAYWGQTGDWVETRVDLSDYVNQNISVRFRFGSNADDATSPPPAAQWYVDNVQILDYYLVPATACITSAEGENNCADVPYRGTLVEPNPIVNTHEVNEELTINVFPNPASEFVHVEFEGTLNQTAQVNLMSVDGRLVSNQTVQQPSNQMIRIETAHLTKGVYIVEIQAGDVMVTEKVIIE